MHLSACLFWTTAASGSYIAAALSLSNLRNYRNGYGNYGESSTLPQCRNMQMPLHLRMSTIDAGIGIESSQPFKSPKSPIEILPMSSSAERQTIKPKRVKIKKDERKTKAKLAREEEKTLTTSIKEMKRLIRIRDDLAAVKTSPTRFPRVPNHMYKEPSDPFANQPSEEEWADACSMTVVELRSALIAGREARAVLVSSNIGLVLQIAKRYDAELRRSVKGGGGNGVGTILGLNDLVQEGNLGLMEAAERFDSERGVRFGTYAAYWVKQRILRSITENSRVIRLPAHVHTTLRTIRKARSDMEKQIGREPSIPELSNHLQIPVKKLQLYTDSSRSVISLNSPLSNGKSSKSGSGDDDKRTIGDRIASDGPTPEEGAELDALKRDIRDAIDGLGNDRERDVLLHRFGLDGSEPCTLEETGKRLGISRERVRVIENRALNKLRHPQRNYRLKEYVGHPCPAEDDDQEIEIYGQKRRMIESKQDIDTLSQMRPEQIWSF